jgi:hypothetical protein
MKRDEEGKEHTAVPDSSVEVGKEKHSETHMHTQVTQLIN